MGEISKIEWCDATFNPWWGCIEVSPACDNCYARTFAKRTGHDIWGAAGTTGRRFFADKHWQEPLKWNAKAEAEGRRWRVFCASMADVFEQNEALDPHRERLWDLISDTPMLDWLLLTKRPQNIMRMVPMSWTEHAPFNVWYGTTVENQHYADQRIPILLGVPAAVRFLSCEPLLGPVVLPFDNISSLPPLPGTEWLQPPTTTTGWYRINDFEQDIHWVITGGESGPGSRPANPNWYRSLRDQCIAAGVAFFFKQWGQWVCPTQAPPDLVNVGSIRAVSLDGASRDEDAIEEVDCGPLAFRSCRADEVFVMRASKTKTGRLLDGRTWDEFPSPRQPGSTGGGGGAP